MKEFLIVKKKASGRRTSRTHNPVFKARMPLPAAREANTLAELCELHPNQITEWKRQLIDRAAQRSHAAQIFFPETKTTQRSGAFGENEFDRPHSANYSLRNRIVSYPFPSVPA